MNDLHIGNQCPKIQEIKIETEIDEEVIRNRQIARKLASKAANQGCPLAGSLADLENLASPFYLGLDEDNNSTDLDVFP